jgi:hypothetical protein
VSDNRKRPPPQEHAAPQTERRRIGTVVHDDRGNASVEWHAAPADHERPVLEVQAEERLALKSEESSYDPYANKGRRTSKGQGSSGGTRTDLRRLSEWIKLMRELEERKRNADKE